MMHQHYKWTDRQTGRQLTVTMPHLHLRVLHHAVKIF